MCLWNDQDPRSSSSIENTVFPTASAPWSQLSSSFPHHTPGSFQRIQTLKRGENSLVSIPLTCPLWPPGTALWAYRTTLPLQQSQGPRPECWLAETSTPPFPGFCQYSLKIYECYSYSESRKWWCHYLTSKWNSLQASRQLTSKTLFDCAELSDLHLIQNAAALLAYLCFLPVKLRIKSKC